MIQLFACVFSIRHLHLISSGLIWRFIHLSIHGFAHPTPILPIQKTTTKNETNDQRTTQTHRQLNLHLTIISSICISAILDLTGIYRRDLGLIICTPTRVSITSTLFFVSKQSNRNFVHPQSLVYIIFSCTPFQKISII